MQGALNERKPRLPKAKALSWVLRGTRNKYVQRECESVGALHARWQDSRRRIPEDIQDQIGHREGAEEMPQREETRDWGWEKCSAAVDTALCVWRRALRRR